MQGGTGNERNVKTVITGKDNKRGFKKMSIGFAFKFSKIVDGR